MQFFDVLNILNFDTYKISYLIMIACHIYTLGWHLEML